jgi:hypothetical protein
MAVTKNAGRQELLVAYVDIPFGDIAAAGEYAVIDLPYGADIVSGYITSGLTGVTDYTLTAEDKDGNTVIADMAGTYGAGRVDLVPVGTVPTVPSELKLTTTGTASAGSIRVVVSYIIDGRACVSEG